MARGAGGESEEKEKGREKTPPDKETGTIWATGRKCGCLEFGPWGRQGRRARPGAGWSGSETCQTWLLAQPHHLLGSGILGR